jgi:hypothetical protein
MTEDVAEDPAATEGVRVGNRLIRCIEQRAVVVASERLIERRCTARRRGIPGEPAEEQRQGNCHRFRGGSFIGAQLLADLGERVAA